MTPPWEEFPEIPFMSIGWRMGPGEDYMHKWWSWMKMKSATQRKAYYDLNSEPKHWSGFYDHFEERISK